MEAIYFLVDPYYKVHTTGKAGIHLKYYPENRDIFEMYPRKVMHIIGG